MERAEKKLCQGLTESNDVFKSSVKRKDRLQITTSVGADVKKPCLQIFGTLLRCKNSCQGEGKLDLFGGCEKELDRYAIWQYE